MNKSETDTDTKTFTITSENNNVYKWIDIKQETKSTNEIGFDSIVFNRNIPFNIGEYRIKLNILIPFKSIIIYSNIVKLDQIQWVYNYNESKARDNDYAKLNNTNNDRKLFHVHKVLFDNNTQNGIIIKCK